MGIHDLFSQNADLSQMISSSGRPQVNSVIHKTRIQVDEKGTVASAATGAMVVPLMGSSGVRMMVDHPFMFIIREVDSGAILFAGRVEQPDSSSGQVENFGNQYQNKDTVVNKNTQRQPSGSRTRVKNPNKPEARPIATNQPSKNYYGENPYNINNAPQSSTNQFLQTNTDTIIGRPFIPLHPQQNRLPATNQYSHTPYQQESVPNTNNYRTNRNVYNLQKNSFHNYPPNEAPYSTRNDRDGTSFPILPD